MGLALLIVIMKSLALWKREERYNRAVRFWTRIFAINFLFGVITGIPMEFQFGTNWARFSAFSGGVIATPLAMEGVFAFFLESSFLGLLLFGEKHFGQKLHWFAALMVFIGSWLSGYFIIVTNGWMQHPVGFQLAANGTANLVSFWSLLLNEWSFWEYLHNMSGAVITASFVMAAVGAFYLLLRRDEDFGRMFLRVGVIAAAIACVFQLWPTGDEQGKLITQYQPTTLAAMEGLFHSESGAPIAIVGQPDIERQKLDNPIFVPHALSFLTFHRWEATVKGLDEFPQDVWPDNIPLLYYSYHIMVGLGTIFIVIMLVALYLLIRKRLYSTRWMLWILMIAFPFPFLANTAGWITAEVGRQPWLIYGIMRTNIGFSQMVSSGNALFTLLGFMGMYVLLSIVYLLLMWHEITHGPAIPERLTTIPPSAKVLPEEESIKPRKLP